MNRVQQRLPRSMSLISIAQKRNIKYFFCVICYQILQAYILPGHLLYFFGTAYDTLIFFRMSSHNTDVIFSKSRLAEAILNFENIAKNACVSFCFLHILPLNKQKEIFECSLSEECALAHSCRAIFYITGFGCQKVCSITYIGKLRKRNMESFSLCNLIP